MVCMYVWVKECWKYFCKYEKYLANIHRPSYSGTWLDKQAWCVTDFGDSKSEFFLITKCIAGHNVSKEVFTSKNFSMSPLHKQNVNNFIVLRLINILRHRTFLFCFSFCLDVVRKRFSRLKILTFRLWKFPKIDPKNG